MAKIKTACRVAVALIFMSVLYGVISHSINCRRHDDGHPVIETSNDVLSLEKEIRMADSRLEGKGWRSCVWASDLAKSILALDSKEARRRLADLYFDEVSSLDPFSERHHDKVRALYNYALMLDSYMRLSTELTDQEVPFFLMCKCIGFYRQAIAECDNMAKENDPSRQRWNIGQKRQLMCDMDLFLQRIYNLYLPWAQSHQLLKDRYEYWKGRFVMEKEVRKP